jgi:hypothetical protein
LINDLTFVWAELYLVTADYYLAKTRRNEVERAKNSQRDALFTYHWLPPLLRGVEQKAFPVGSHLPS